MMPSTPARVLQPGAPHVAPSHILPFPCCPITCCPITHTALQMLPPSHTVPANRRRCSAGPARPAAAEAVRRLPRRHVDQAGLQLPGDPSVEAATHCALIKGSKTSPAAVQDCTFNLCINCFETKSGELQGDEEENVVRGDKGKKKKMALTSGEYAKRCVLTRDSN